MKIINIIIGLLTLFNGWSIFRDPIWCSWYRERCADFTGFNREVGVFLMLLGVGILYLSYKYRNRKEQTYICPVCLKPFEVINGKKHICKKCQVELEPMKGFYVRHPELKDKD